MRITAIFKDDRRGRWYAGCCAIFEKHKGEHPESGCFLETGVRVVEYDVPHKHIEPALKELKKAGFKAFPTMAWARAARKAARRAGLEPPCPI